MKFISFLSKINSYPVQKKQKFNDKSEASRIEKLKTYTLNTVKYLNIQAIENKRKPPVVPPTPLPPTPNPPPPLPPTPNPPPTTPEINLTEFANGLLDGCLYSSISYFVNVPSINIESQTASYKEGYYFATVYAVKGLDDGFINGQSHIENNKPKLTTTLTQTTYSDYAIEYSYTIGYNNAYIFYTSVYLGISKALDDTTKGDNIIPYLIYNKLQTYNSITQYKTVNYYEYGYYVGYTQTKSGSNNNIYYSSYLNGFFNLYSTTSDIDINNLLGFDKGYSLSYKFFNEGLTQGGQDCVELYNVNEPNNIPPEILTKVLTPNINSPYENGYAYGWGIEQGMFDSNVQPDGILSDYYIEEPTTNKDYYMFNMGYYYGYIGSNRYLNPAG
jgi:hypothetical protein